MTLPLEISQMILDCLVADDTKTLAACSLVCSSWLHSTRQLFLPEKNIPLFVGNGMKREATNQYDFLRSLLSSPHCTIIPYVHKLNITGIWPAPTISLAGLFTEVTSLTITDVAWYYLSPCTPSSFSAMFPHLLDLSIHGSETVFESNTEFFEFICAFPDLARLSIEQMDMGWELEQELDVRKTHLPSSLTTLAISGNRASDILQWVLAHDDLMPPVREFSVGAVALNELTITALYLEHLGANLETFTFDLGGEYPSRSIAPQFFTDINLSHHPRLSTIHIHSFPNPSIDSRRNPWIYNIFACGERSLFHTMDNNSIQPPLELVLHMSYSASELTDVKVVHNWSALDETFSQPPFQPRLKSLRFCLSQEMMTDCTAVAGLVEERLPECNDLGILAVGMV